MLELDALDKARLRDIARLQITHRERVLSPDERGEIFSVVSVLLRRHHGSDENAQTVVEALLQFADTADQIATPTIETIIKAAHRRSQIRDPLRAVGRAAVMMTTRNTSQVLPASAPIAARRPPIPRSIQQNMFGGCHSETGARCRK